MYIKAHKELLYTLLPLVVALRLIFVATIVSSSPLKFYKKRKKSLKNSEHKLLGLSAKGQREKRGHSCRNGWMAVNHEPLSTLLGFLSGD